MSWWIWILIGLFLLWLTGNLFTGPLQHYFIMRPKKSLPDTTYHFPDLFREISFTPEQGIHIHTLWFQTKNRPPKGVILYLHGNAGNLERWGEVGPRFTHSGYDILIPDYRSFGKSNGRPTEKNLVADANFIWKFIRENYPGIPAFIFGRSIGSGVACALAANNQAEGLILETPFSGMRRLFFTYYPFLPPVFRFQFRFPNLIHLKKVQFPILVFAGTRDWVVPYRNAKEIKKVLKDGDKFVALSGGGHSHLYDFEEYRKDLEVWLKEKSEIIPQTHPQT